MSVVERQATTSQKPPYPDFPEDEYKLRWGRARSLMAKANLDALFITEPKNYMYFTGHRSDQITGDKIRPFVVLLPANGEPICLPSMWLSPPAT